MLPLIGLAGGAALGLGKHFLVDKPRQERQTKLAVAKEMMSPWTGVHGEMPQDQSAIESAINGTMLGGVAEQSFAPGATGSLWARLAAQQGGAPDEINWEEEMAKGHGAK